MESRAQIRPYRVIKYHTHIVGDLPDLTRSRLAESHLVIAEKFDFWIG